MVEEGQTILLVEDLEDDAFFFKNVLERAGLNNPVSVVSNRYEAIACLNGEGTFADRERYPIPAVVVLELMLPLNEGFRLLSWIKSQRHLEGLTVIVLTYSLWDKDWEHARQLGADYIFLKSCKLDDLNKVAECLKNCLDFGHPAKPQPEEFPVEHEPENTNAALLLAALSARLK